MQMNFETNVEYYEESDAEVHTNQTKNPKIEKNTLTLRLHIASIRN